MFASYLLLLQRISVWWRRVRKVTRHSVVGLQKTSLHKRELQPFLSQTGSLDIHRFYSWMKNNQQESSLLDVTGSTPIAAEYFATSWHYIVKWLHQGPITCPETKQHQRQRSHKSTPQLIGQKYECQPDSSQRLAPLNLVIWTRLLVIFNWVAHWHLL